MSDPAWAAHERVLLHGGSIYAPSSPFATAMLIDGDTIAWLGEDSAAAVYRDAADRVVDLRGSLVTPGFVDAHVHATDTGLTLTGLDLSATDSLAQALVMLERRARELRGGLILGHGWDDTRWPEGRPPTRAEIDRATFGSVVYLSRIDVHSAAVSSALVAMVPDVRSLAGYDDALPLTQHAHHAVRVAARAAMSPTATRDAHRVARAAAAEQGIVCMHEMGGPSISSASDLQALIQLAEEEPGPLVFGYWGQLAQEGGIETARAVGAYAVGGDLSVDGALGSRTACLSHAYSDAPDTTGARYLSTDQITEHVQQVTAAGMQAAFHAIGDSACASVAEGLAAAAEVVGADTMRRSAHRVEHAEMVSDEAVEIMSRLGIIASMQPMFDGLWGSPDGMYVRRLGADRAGAMNRMADLARAGVALAFGSDSPVTSLGPWAAVRAAVLHHNPDQRISARAAFSAHTRGGWRAVNNVQAGVLAAGAPAHFALWQAEDVAVQAPDERVAAWSTDPRSGTPGLPVLEHGAPLPRCLRTVIAGRTVFDAFDE